MGRPKHLLELEGRTFLDWCLTALLGVVDEVLVSIASDQLIPPLPRRARAIQDEHLLAGPLAGICAAMREVSAPAAVVVSCDAPLLRSKVVDLLFDSLGDNDLAVPIACGRPQLFPGVYRQELGDVAARLLARGSHSMRALLNERQVGFLPEELMRKHDPTLVSFRNINSPEEYDELVRDASRP